ELFSSAIILIDVLRLSPGALVEKDCKDTPFILTLQIFFDFFLLFSTPIYITYCLQKANHLILIGLKEK
ncbi:MAG: hypothetical protein ACI3ZQ_11035, partial [Candidatus Cryptobacteroides sp.]